MTSNPSGEAGRTAAQWTPGPWKVHGSHVYSSDKAILAVVNNPGSKESFYPLIANAKLIAKAPEMAAILQEIVELVRAEAQVDNGEGLKFLNASAQLVTAERILREAGAL
jgi:hypothetical protein